MINFSAKSTDLYVHDVEERAYVSRKINKICWKPEGLDDYSSFFVTGSYDDHRRCGIDLWSFSKLAEPDLQPKLEFAPEHLSGLMTGSNVTDLRFLDNKNNFAYCTHDGNVSVSKVAKHMDNYSLEGSGKVGPNEWFGNSAVSCSSMDVCEKNLAVASTDGRICLVAAECCKSSGTILGSIPVKAIKFVSTDELVTGSLLGSISLWDLRTNSTTPTQLFPLCRTQRVGVTSLTVFPTEKHMLVCGGRNGIISVFDIRSLPVPVKVFSTTNDAVADLMFHPTRYSVLFSVSNQGTIWQWSNFFQLFDPLRKQNSADVNGDQSLMLEYKTVPAQVKCLLNNSKFYTNCIDINKDRLLCGTDNECVIAIKNLIL